MQGECKPFCRYFYFLNAGLAVFPLLGHGLVDPEAVHRFVTGFLQDLSGASGRRWEDERRIASCSCLLRPGVVLSSATTSRSAVHYGKPRLLSAQQGGVGSCGLDRALHVTSLQIPRPLGVSHIGCEKWRYCWPPCLVRLARDGAAGLS